MSPHSDSFRDEAEAKGYDHRLMSRLLKYLMPDKRRVALATLDSSLAAVEPAYSFWMALSTSRSISAAVSAVTVKEPRNNAKAESINVRELIVVCCIACSSLE